MQRRLHEGREGRAGLWAGAAAAVVAAPCGGKPGTLPRYVDEELNFTWRGDVTPHSSRGKLFPQTGGHSGQRCRRHHHRFSAMCELPTTPACGSRAQPDPLPSSARHRCRTNSFSHAPGACLGVPSEVWMCWVDGKAAIGERAVDFMAGVAAASSICLPMRYTRARVGNQ